MKSIGLFVQFSQALGQPRSVAEIYGLLFISHLPLSLDEIIARLNMSRGSGSQGLNYLLDLGAIRTVYVSGQRRIHYEAVAELRNLAGRFLHQQILVHLQSSSELLGDLEKHARELAGEPRNHAIARAKMLRSWERNGRRVLPLMLALLGAKNVKNGKKGAAVRSPLSPLPTANGQLTTVK